jgi:integrase
MRNMGRALHRLSAIKVAKAKPGMHNDGYGLYLRVASGGSKSWIYRYAVDGKVSDMGLGSALVVTLAQARKIAQECRELRQQGLDPIRHRGASRISRARSLTFRECSERYIASHDAGWRSAKHRESWPRSLQEYVYPIFGDLLVQEIDTARVLDVLSPIWHSKTETAARVRGRLELVLDWATAAGLREGENPARWRGHLAHLLPARSKVRKIVHHKALPYGQIGAFMTKLRAHPSMAARVLEFLILTAARLGEARGVIWNEIDLAAKMWTVPADRMKAGKEHRVPLSDAAVALLNDMKAIRRGDFVFHGARDGRPVSAVGCLILVRQLTGETVTVHGFRSCFRDWAAETTGYPNHVVEMALAHQIGNAVEAAYRRGDLFEKRRKLMGAWAKYCGAP